MESLKELQKEWYGILKEGGFRDVEMVLDQNGNLQENTLPMSMECPSRTCFREGESVVFEAKRRYYELCSHFLHDFQFSNPFLEAIWAKHSEGCSIRDIMKAFGLTSYAVRELIPKLKRKMMNGDSR